MTCRDWSEQEKDDGSDVVALARLAAGDGNVACGNSTGTAVSSSPRTFVLLLMLVSIAPGQTALTRTR